MGLPLKLLNYKNMYIHQLSHMKITGSATFFVIYVACYIISSKHLNVPFISVLNKTKMNVLKLHFIWQRFFFLAYSNLSTLSAC